MSRRDCISGALILMAGFVGVSTSWAMQFDPPEVEFGRVYHNQVLRQEVLLINAGSAPVTVQAVRCSPPASLTAYLENERIEPAGVTVLVVELKTQQHEGAFHGAIAVRTDHGNQEVSLVVRADVAPAYRVSGDPLFFDYRIKPRPAFRAVQVDSLIRETVELDVSAITDPYFDVTVLPTSEGGERGQKLRVRAKEPLPCGLIQRDIVVPSKQDGAPPCRLVVAGFNPPVVHAYPDELLVSAVDREQLRIVFVEQYLDEPAQIVRVETPHRGIHFRRMPESTRFKQRLNIYFRELNDVKGDLGDLVLVTDNPDLAEVRIPIRIVDRADQSLRLPNDLNFVGPKSRCACLR